MKHILLRLDDKWFYLMTKEKLKIEKEQMKKMTWEDYIINLYRKM